ncbi:MAG: phosphoglycolate phosphatase [Candidatus Helarchaeota archaeon]
MDVRAIATDLDGTITDRIGILDLEAIKKIRLLEKNNIPVIIVSGQNAYSASTLSYYIGTSNVTVAENGGVISYFFSQLKFLGTREHAEDGLKLLKLKYGDKIKTTFNTHLRHRDITLQKRFNFKEAKDYLINEKSEAKLLDSGFVYHILDKSISKGLGLKEALNIYNKKKKIADPIHLENVISIGDAQNDRELLDVTNYGIALKHSPKSLREIADFVTTKRYGKGFSEAIDHVIKEFGLILK